MVNQSTMRISALRPGDHVGWLYHTAAEHRQVLQSFLRQGVERGEKVIYLRDNCPPEAVLGYLGQDDMAVAGYLQRGQLSIQEAVQVYCPEGRFAPETMIQWLQTQTDQALAQGYVALRVTGEMTWACRKLTGTAPVLEYEARLDQCLSDWACLTLCQYDRRYFEAAWLLEILTAHPLLIIGTEIFSNLYHSPRREVANPELAAVRLANRLYTVIRHKRSEQRLQESEEKYRNLFENAQVGIFRTRISDGKILEGNRRAAEMVGYKDFDQFIKEFVAAEHYINPADRDRMLASFQDGELKNFETRFYRKDGDIIWVLFSGRIYPERGYIEGVATDITERKRMEEVLKESEQRYRLLAENVTDVIWTTDLNLKQTYISPSIKPLRGFSPQEVLAQNLEDIFPPDSLEKIKQAVAEEWRLEQQEPKDFSRSHTLEAEQYRKDGSTVWTEIKVSLLRDAKGQPVGYLGITRDITERRQTEIALKRREAALAALSYAAEKFMQTPSWELYIQEVLGSLGEALQVSRAYILQKQGSQTEEWSASQTYAWVAPGISPRSDNLRFQKPDRARARYGRWFKRLSQGQAIWGQVRQLPPDAQEFWRSQDIKSFVMVPVFVEHQWWGVIGLDECFQEREWAAVELEALRAAASTLGAAIEHERIYKALRESESNLHYLTAELITAQERERHRISSELHNELGQSLMALKYHLRALKRQLQPEQQLLQVEFESLFEYIDEVIENVRRLCRDLSPTILEELGLTAAIQYLVNDFKTYYEIQQCQAQIENIDSLFPPKWQTIIYRAVQELLTNIGKHAEPTWVSITIKRINKEVLLEIADNGNGFKLEQRLGSETPKDGLGLLVIAERLRILGGQLEIQSQEHQGTEVTIIMPIFVEGS